jgi:hypothetical protein
MPVTRTILLVLAACIMLLSCRKNFSSGQIVDDKLVVLAEATAFDSIKIPVGKTIKVGNGGVIRFEKVMDAAVMISEEGGQKWQLQPGFSMQYSVNPTSVYTSRRRFKPNTNYTLEVKHPSLGTVTATTHIPAQLKPVSIDTASAMFNGRYVLAANITLQDVGGSNDYYVIEALKELVKVTRYFYYSGQRYDYDTPQGSSLYEQVKNNAGVRLVKDTVSKNKFQRLYVFTEDNSSENVRIDQLTNPFRRIFFTDHDFDGQTFATKVYIDPQLFLAADAGQKGKVRLQVKLVNKSFYDYLLAYEKYKTDFGAIPANQLPSPDGNIGNGLGIFGGASRREKVFYFDVL